MKQTKFFIPLLVAVLFSSVLYLIIVNRSINNLNQAVRQGGDKPAAKVDLGLLEANYKIKTKLIFDNYQRLTQDPESATVDQIRLTREQLLDLKVPAKFKQLHLDLVMAMSKMEDYINNGDGQKLLDSRQLVAAIKTNNAWLN